MLATSIAVKETPSPPLLVRQQPDGFTSSYTLKRSQVGLEVGLLVGLSVGLPVGLSVGRYVGRLVGRSVGELVVVLCSGQLHASGQLDRIVEPHAALRQAAFFTRLAHTSGSGSQLIDPVTQSKLHADGHIELTSAFSHATADTIAGHSLGSDGPS